jgi:hypothetical protein
MPRLLGLGTEYYLFGGAAVVKATAAVLSLFVLAALLLLGVALGVLIVVFWDEITRILPGLD